MKSKDVIVGGTYLVKMSGKLTSVKITEESPYGGWVGKNIVTGGEVRIKSAQKLRVPVGATLKEYAKEEAPHVLCEQTPVS